jgi:apoptosis-inducing factor 3
MNPDQTQPFGPDLTKGIDAALLADGAMLLGHIGQDPVILARSGGEVFAIGATCTHYGGPLAEGLLVGDTVRCPWHHACFSMRTGEAICAPALNPVACWSVETIDGRHFVRGRHELPSRAARRSSAGTPASIVILGAMTRSGVENTFATHVAAATRQQPSFASKRVTPPHLRHAHAAGDPRCPKGLTLARPH